MEANNNSSNSSSGRGTGSFNFRGLSSKLLWLTIGFIMLAEILIFIPSVANFRNVWLRTHLDIAESASIVYLDIEDNMLSDQAEASLLETTKSITIAVRREGKSEMLASTTQVGQVSRHIDLDAATPVTSIKSALAMLFQPSDQAYRVSGALRSGNGTIELVQKVSHIQNAMWAFAGNVLVLSLIISVFAAGLVYLTLYRLIVRPIIKISANMDAFSKQPENSALIYKPTKRQDEIGVAEARLSAFQSELRETLRQKQRLAELGLAVAKINHDLRNILASAQLFSDRLTELPDPTVQRFAPKLIRTLDRAIDYTKSVIDYGKATETPPKPGKIRMHELVNEVGEHLDLATDGAIGWRNSVRHDLEIYTDPEHLFRILMNLCRNAQQALSDLEGDREAKMIKVSAERDGEKMLIRVSDTASGIPEHLKETLFNAFQGSTKADGTGLGMSIAAELTRSLGGLIELEESSSEGTTFLIILPDITE